MRLPDVAVVGKSIEDIRDYQQALIDLDDPEITVTTNSIWCVYFRDLQPRFIGLSKEEIKVRLTMENKVYYQCT